MGWKLNAFGSNTSGSLLEWGTFGYSGQNFNITANEYLMPQDHPWTETPFGYSAQNLEILDTTANESINVKNILIEEMHDSIL